MVNPLRRLAEDVKHFWHFPHTSRPVKFVMFGLVLAVIGPIVTDFFYPGELIWTLVSGGFTGAVLAFLVALAWDRHQGNMQEAREAATEQRRQEQELHKEQERRTLEAKRRFSAIALELERLQASINRTAAEQATYKYFFPDLPTGSWRAASVPLGMISSNYGLIADLATFYGHVDELQWRLRFKADPAVDEAKVNPIIDGFVAQMQSAVEDLLGQVRRQSVRPDVESVLSDGAAPTVVTRRQMTGAIRAVDTGGQTPLAGLEGTAPPRSTG
jgi:hypothetical protein